MEPNVPAKKNVSDMLSRRQALAGLVALGTTALFINPLMGLAIAGETRKGRIVINIDEVDIVDLESSSVYYTKISVSYDSINFPIMAYVVRDVSPEGILMPSLVISEEGNTAKLLAAADDTEYILTATERKNSIDEYIEFILQESEKQNKKKLKRYINIIKKAHEKRKEKNEKRREQAAAL